MIAIVFLFCLAAGLQTFAVSQINNFDQFVRFYGKRYKDDEYALLHCFVLTSRSRRQNFVENSAKKEAAERLTGIDLQYSFYSDFSETRFRKYLMINNRYPTPDRNEIPGSSPREDEIPPSADWRSFFAPIVDIDPSIKCASSWAVAVTSLLYIKHKEQDPLWDVYFRIVCDLQEPFSVQQLLDCVVDRHALSPDTCEGASLESALRYVYEKGLCLEKDYRSYTGTREKCQRTSCDRVLLPLPLHGIVFHFQI